MAVLLLTKKAGTIREAARLVAEKASGASVPAKVDRLRSKYAKQREELEKKAGAALERHRKPVARRSAAVPDRKDVGSPASSLNEMLDDLATRINRDYENSAVQQTLRYMEQRSRMLNLDEGPVDAVLKSLRKLDPE